MENEGKISELKTGLVETEQNAKNDIIKANTDGYVTNLSDGINGSVVTSGMQLLSIVPEDTEMEIQCYVNNRDISEIKAGMEAVIKLEAYPYSDYGTLKGKVTYISNGAVSNKQFKNVYPVKLAVDYRQAESKGIQLIPGLNPVVEFKSGKRSVMQYFTDPITGALKNSLKEK